MTYAQRVERLLDSLEEPVQIITTPAVQDVVQQNMQYFGHEINVMRTTLVESENALIESLQLAERSIVAVPTTLRSQRVLRHAARNTTFFSEFLYWSYTDSFTPADFAPPSDWRRIFRECRILQNSFVDFLRSSSYADNLAELRASIPARYTFRELLAFETLLETDFRLATQRFKTTSFYENTAVFVRPGDTVVDCGACSAASGGQFVTQFAQTVGRAGKVIAIEPIKQIYTELLEDTQYDSNVNLMNAAASDFRGAREIITDGISSSMTDGFFGLVHPAAEREKVTETVHTLMLDELSADNQIEFVKMDIEGSEAAAIRGAKTLLRDQQPKLAICTYHSPSDFIEIPKLICSFADYEFYLECNEGKPWSGMKILGRARRQ